MVDRALPKRCEACARPSSRCLCSTIPRLHSSTRMLIIQHPSERHHALNTARFLAAGLVNAELHVVEHIAPGSALYSQLADPARRTEVLFPGPGASSLARAADPREHQLVLLDGTWRKARKLLHLNPILAVLPQVALAAGLASRYRLRKAPAPGALSTIEAGVAALEVLEPDKSFQALLRPFDRLIEEQIASIGTELYRRNYLKPGSADSGSDR
ncbi:DTW domain-containing protein YfiP [Halopseudomonas xinjiangensis]|uniref:tRNA-uridine aminocarboxypropyltransferase n=1 Tax=Halopseudomonas xinjiangensis TaxID=487184 RepID=A0A1H1U8F1_9GAMM|nr:DTW domain-containing protein [Halopseudomonas xinjiangensis]SDS68647.1 DTW domain-containing protein YfiP [Halopseudomonas xinjiangensis]